MKFSKGKVFMLSILVSAVFYLGYIYYVNKVLNNDIRSSASTQIRQMSNPYNPFELLYYGRNDAVIAIYAIADKPLLGFGSWAKDKNGKYSKIQGQLLESVTIKEKEYIPNHSLLLGTWLFSGIFGFLGICYVLTYLFKEFIKIYNNKIISPILPVLTVLTIDMCWAMFFSPYGLLRTTFPVFAALIIVFQKKYEQI
jgi:O-antigen ligase